MNEATFDVYGRFLVHVALAPGGWWEAAEIGYEGKRRPLPEVLVPEYAGLDDLPAYLEAAFRGLARPGETIVRVK
jgi:hypothetical protein